ncbi:MAG: hypothetical protein FGM43_06740 [Sinobacteraceae bacterium]|nr:hypothetical protein [Nevskiaceae bacterium]
MPEHPAVWRNDALLQLGASDVRFGDVSLTELAATRGTPLYVYHSDRILENISALRDALGRIGRPFRIRYAMKCNRYVPVLDLIRAEGDIGIDACSPREVELALSRGFTAGEITVTASNLANADLRLLAQHGIHLNSDTCSVARRFGALGAGGSFGLRLDPPRPLQRDSGEKLNYIGGKFGVSRADLPAVYAAACAAGLNVNTLHVHCGWSMQSQHAVAFDAAMGALADTFAELPGIRTLNVGGGLAHRHRIDDQPMSIDTWSQIISRRLGHLPVTIECEIGTYIMANAGLLLTAVNTAERRSGQDWLGVDVGHAVNVYAYHYGIPLELVPVSRPHDAASRVYHVGSNINEAEDLLAREAALPETREGDLLALYCTGAYGAAMQSDHCLRGAAPEHLI